MPKIYAKHNSIPCGFMTAKKPGGKSRGQIPQQNIFHVLMGQLLREGAALYRRLCSGPAPEPPEELSMSYSQVPFGLCFVQEALFCLLSQVRGTHSSKTGRRLNDEAGGGNRPDCITQHPFASRVGFSSMRGAVALLRSRRLRVFPHCSESSETG